MRDGRGLQGFWIRYDFKGADVREPVCRLRGVKRATKRDAQRVLAARPAQQMAEPGAELPGARLSASEHLLTRCTLETLITLAQAALARLDSVSEHTSHAPRSLQARGPRLKQG
jgi:hypothetical protein